MIWFPEESRGGCGEQRDQHEQTDGCHSTGQGEGLQWEAGLARAQGRGQRLVQEGLEGSIRTTVRDCPCQALWVPGNSSPQLTTMEGRVLLEKTSLGAAWAPATAWAPHPSKTQPPLSTVLPSCLICLIRPLPGSSTARPLLCPCWGSQPRLSPEL